MNTNTINIPLTKIEENRLARLSLSYGLSLKDFVKLILQEISSDLPTESFEDYDNPEKLKVSYIQAIKDYKAGRIQTSL